MLIEKVKSICKTIPRVINSHLSVGILTALLGTFSLYFFENANKFEQHLERLKRIELNVPDDIKHLKVTKQFVGEVQKLKDETEKTGNSDYLNEIEELTLQLKLLKEVREQYNDFIDSCNIHQSPFTYAFNDFNESNRLFEKALEKELIDLAKVPAEIKHAKLICEHASLLNEHTLVDSKNYIYLPVIRKSSDPKGNAVKLLDVLKKRAENRLKGIGTQISDKQNRSHVHKPVCTSAQSGILHTNKSISIKNFERSVRTSEYLCKMQVENVVLDIFKFKLI